MPNPLESVRAIARDDRSGATALARRAATALSRLESRREVGGAARILLRAKPAMAPLWHVCAAAWHSPGSRDAEAYVERLIAEQQAAARNARWLAGSSRHQLVVTVWSDASALRDALKALGSRIGEVRCGRSEPGGEGRRLVTFLRRHGIRATMFEDADVMRALDGADLALIGADAIGELVANKVGSRMLATVARAEGVATYAVAATAKLLPADLVERATSAGTFESMPASLLSGVVTEAAPRSARWLAARSTSIEVPRPIRTAAFGPSRSL